MSGNICGHVGKGIGGKWTCGKIKGHKNMPPSRSLRHPERHHPFRDAVGQRREQMKLATERYWEDVGAGLMPDAPAVRGVTTVDGKPEAKKRRCLRSR